MSLLGYCSFTDILMVANPSNNDKIYKSKHDPLMMPYFRTSCSIFGTLKIFTEDPTILYFFILRNLLEKRVHPSIYPLYYDAVRYLVFKKKKKKYEAISLVLKLFNKKDRELNLETVILTGLFLMVERIKIRPNRINFFFFFYFLKIIAINRII